MEVQKNQDKKDFHLKARKVSLIGKITGGIILVVGFVLKSLGIFDCDVDDLIKVSFSIVAIFAPIDLNISLDKFLHKEKENVS